MKEASLKVGDKVTRWSQWTMTGRVAPVSLHEVTKAGKLHVTLDDGTKYRINGSPAGPTGGHGRLRLTEPGDAHAIEAQRTRDAIGQLSGRELDAEAVMAIGPAVIAWKARQARREKRLRAAIRVALIGGSAPDGALSAAARAVTGTYHGRDNISGLARSIGATKTPDSSHERPIYTRTPTREDAIDATLLRKMGGEKGWATAIGLLAAVAKDLGVADPETLRKDVIEACDRVGVIPNTGDRFMLQTWEKP